MLYPPSPYPLALPVQQPTATGPVALRVAGGHDISSPATDPNSPLYQGKDAWLGESEERWAPIRGRPIR